MQDRYAGDIGDYVKMAFLRELERQGACKLLGVAWYRVPSEDGTEDGRYTQYLSAPGYWRHFCARTFDKLKGVVGARRSVARLQRTGLLRNVRFHEAAIDARKCGYGSRREARRRWFNGVAWTLRSCDLVFADPDNGIEPEKFDHEDVKAHKSATFPELRKLARAGRALLVYHHQARRKGGHLREIDALHRRLRANQLRPNGTLRIGPWSPRLLILVNATRAQIETAREFARHWGKEVLWFPAHARAANRRLPRGLKRTRP